MIELERTFLAKRLPKGLDKCRSKEIIDIYIPFSDPHPRLRLRKNGNVFEMTKKSPTKGTDSSVQKEQTIGLTEEEFKYSSRLQGKVLSKIRYYYNFNGRMAEVDVFQSGLKGLVLIDFEFRSRNEMNAFKMPDFCLADVTQEKFAAGGMLCGKLYKDVEKHLKKYGYKKLLLKSE